MTPGEQSDADEVQDPTRAKCNEPAFWQAKLFYSISMFFTN